MLSIHKERRKDRSKEEVDQDRKMDGLAWLLI
jgi:hypothetical protein